MFLPFIMLAQTSMTVSIIPEPRSVTLRPGHFKITSSTKIIVGTGTATGQFIAGQISDDLSQRKEISLTSRDEKSVRKLSSNYIFLGRPNSAFAKKFIKERKINLLPEMKAEGYCIDIDPNGIVILAESEKGLLYGAMSLLQMVSLDGRSLVAPHGTIVDYPMQKIRGITDDISRGQISTVENFKKIIRYCAGNKINVYMPYIEDVFLFKNHSVLGKDRGALTAAEWKEIDSYAKKYFVEVIPIFETLGHWENILIHPDYGKYAEFPGAHTVNVSDEKVYALLDEMIGEISSAFSSPYFHIAADESWDVGLGVNKNRVAQSDLASVHADHYKRVFAIVKKYGKKPMMYGDIILNHPEILQKIPNDVVIVDWHYGANFNFPSTDIFKNAGFPFIVSPAVWNFTGPFPNYLNSFVNIANLNSDGYQNGSMGMVCSSWNDFGGEALRELNYYGYAWAAECAWNPVNPSMTRFDEKFFASFFGTGQEKLRTVYAILSNPANQYHWYEIWRHPLLPNRDNMIWEVRLPLIQRMQSIKSTMPFVLSVLDEAAKEVTVNKDQLRTLEFIARLNLWFAKKIEAQEKIKLTLKDTALTMSDKCAQIIALSKPVIGDLAERKKEFAAVWLTTNKPHGLDLLMQRYDRQIAYWQEIVDRASAGDANLDPAIPSQWIYHPNAHPGQKDSSQVATAVFVKKIGPLSNVRSSLCQVLGDSWAKLFVNGTFVGEVMARRSLSLIVENQRAKIFDIKPFLKDSDNVVTVEAQNFQENGSAGMNFYSEISFNDGSTTTMSSDESWSVSDSDPKTGNAGSSIDSLWRTAKPVKYPFPVIKPNLAAGRTSWFER